ncbi:MAG: translation initiation factor 2 [Deltaproteobacteria bacterium]|nr:translation initiation factor 2 [Deltaproteobacteria bacterium]
MFKQVALLVPAAALLGACASIVEGTDQSIAVSSHPSGAICILEREGGQIGVVNPTPGTVRIEKSTEDIMVRCSKPGYQDGIGVLVSEFEGMTAGNIIFGGVIGLAVDAGSGAMYYYPSSIMVDLPPE